MEDNERFDDFDEEVCNAVLDFERTVMRGASQFFDAEELEMIIDFYLETNDGRLLRKAVSYAEQMYPNHTGIALRRAHERIADGKYRDALDILHRLQKVEPDNTDIDYSLGVAYSAIGDPKQAIDHFLATANDGWQLGRIYANIAEEYIKLSEDAKAAEYYQKAVAEDVDDIDTLYNYTDFCNETVQSSSAADFLKQIVDSHPYKKEAWHCLGCTYRSLGLYDQAMEAFEYAIAIDESFFPVYMDASVCEEQAGHVGEAATWILRGLPYADKKDEVYEQLSVLYSQAMNAEMSLQYGLKALELNPANVTARVYVAVSYNIMGETSNAQTEIHKALRIAPNDPNALMVAANIYETLGDIKRADEYFEKLLAANCAYSHYANYAQFLLRHERWDELYTICQSLLSVDPTDLYFFTLLCIAEYRRGNTNTAHSMIPHADFDMLVKWCPEMLADPECIVLLRAAKADRL